MGKETTKKEESTKSEKSEKSEIDFKTLSEKDKNALIENLIKENEDLKTQLENAENTIKTQKDSWYRTAADFENFKKRNQETRINAYREGKTDIILKILIIGDGLDRALSMPLDDKSKEGIALLQRQFIETLEAEGITSINPVGEVFDPNTQEAIMKVPPEENEVEGTIKQVFLKGYKLGDRVIRYAQVVVIG